MFAAIICRDSSDSTPARRKALARDVRPSHRVREKRPMTQTPCFFKVATAGHKDPDGKQA
jgi:hypothetical protein